MFKQTKWRSLGAGVLVALSLMVSGCAVWTRVDTAVQEGPGSKYRVEAPIGWVRFALATDSILITRDGVPIQHILVTKQKDSDYFRQTKVKLPANTLPSDLAQMMLAEIRSDKNLSNLVVKQTEPYTVAGQPGFRVHLQYRNERGALFDRIVLGTSKGDEVIAMVYHGLNTHYFSRDLDTFYKVAGSFKS